MKSLGDIVGARVAQLVEQGGSRSKNTLMGQVLRKQGVARTSEFKRIEDLPRRDWRADPSIDAAIAELHEMLRLPGGDEPCDGSWCETPEPFPCRCPRELWKEQAVALIEIAAWRGAFCPLGVGKGKALVSILAHTLLGAERPLLLVPAQLRDQTVRKVLPLLRRRWRVPENLRVHGYSELSVASGRRMLLEYRPTHITADEAHYVKNPQAARTKRLAEYLKQEPFTTFVPLSGSSVKRSLRDYWQLILWALKDRAPLPDNWREVQDWADALDEGVMEQDRIGPGALVLLCEGEETPREGYRRRLTHTPGVVASGEEELDTSLVIATHRVEVPGRVVALMTRMRETWETPYGEEILEAVELWRHMRELACGFYYRWDPPAPKLWLERRKAWRKWVRDTLRTNRRGLDSEMVLTNYIDHRVRQSGLGADKLDALVVEGSQLLSAWRLVRNDFEPNTVAEWVDDFAVRAASLWLQTSVDDEHVDGGIAWTDHVAFGEALETESGFRYFGAGMKAAAGILDARGPIIASIPAHSEGKNLQRWARALVCTPPSSGKLWEQLIGREHRKGQMADEVEFDVWSHAEELKASLAQAIRDARYIEQTIGARQKLCYADITVNLEGLA